MTCFPTTPAYAVILGTFLAISAQATTAPASKRPVARRAHPALLAKPAASCCGTAAPAPAKPAEPQQSGPSAAIAAVVTPVTTAAASAPAAPQVVQLRGVVRLPDGKPCAGASVYPAGAPRQLVVTDAQGNFALPVPASGPTSLRVEYFGVGSSRVEVPAPTAATLSIVLGR